MFDEWQAGAGPVSIFRAADAVGLQADAPATSIERRIAELEGAARAGGRQELEGFLGWLKASLSAES